MLDQNLLFEYKDFLKKRKLAYLSLKNYVSQISKFMREHDSWNDIKIFVNEMKNPNRVQAVRHFVAFLKENGENVDELVEYMEHFKAIISERKETQTLEYSRGVMLIKELIKKNEHKLAVICMICYDAGVRIRAVLKLRKKDIEPFEDKIYLNFIEKRGKPVRRLITKETYNQLIQVFDKENMKDETYLFFGKERVMGEELDKKYQELWSKIKNISRKLFKTGVSFHWLRRGAGVFIYNRTGKDLVAAGDFLAQNDFKQTKKYLKIQAEKAEEVIENEKRPW